MKKIKNHFIQNRNYYLFIIALVIVGIIVGSLFLIFMDKPEKEIVSNQIEEYYQIIKNPSDNYLIIFLKSFLKGVIPIIFIWVLGISIIGLPITSFLTFFNGFSLGFSISALIIKYQAKGLLYALFYLLPHNLIYLLMIILISFFSLRLLIQLFNSILKKKEFNFGLFLPRYSFNLITIIIVTLFCSAYEVFINPLILRLLNI